MKTFFNVILVLLTALGTATASTVSLSITSNTGPMFTTSTGGMLSMGSCVRIGTFDLTGGNLSIISSSDDYHAVNALFTPLGETGGANGEVAQINNGSTTMLMINDFFGQGNILGQIANISPTQVTTGRQLFAWVFDSAAPESASQWGIFSSSSLWGFPNVFGSETLATFEVDTILRGDHTGTLGSLTSTDQLRLSPVPEPGSLILVLGACLALRLRRSRRSSF